MRGRYIFFTLLGTIMSDQLNILWVKTEWIRSTVFRGEDKYKDLTKYSLKLRLRLSWVTNF